MGARPYLAFKNLLELITENRATAVGARIRAEPETFIEYARVAVCPLCVQLLPKLMQERPQRATTGREQMQQRQSSLLPPAREADVEAPGGNAEFPIIAMRSTGAIGRHRGAGPCRRRKL